MKFNWGTGIFIFYSIFALALVFQVYKSTLYDNSLVTDNYYEVDLAYQEIIDKKSHSLALEKPLFIIYDAKQEQVKLQFPKDIQSVEGEVLLYRADDKNKDLIHPIALGKEADMLIPVKDLTDGLWKIVVDWKGDGIDFMDEKQIFL